MLLGWIVGLRRGDLSKVMAKALRVGFQRFIHHS
jgi:hypothetical protein